MHLSKRAALRSYSATPDTDVRALDASWAWNEEPEETEEAYLPPAPSPGAWSHSSQPATAYS